MRPIPEQSRVRLRDPADCPLIGSAVGIVVGRTVISKRLRITFPTITYHGRSVQALFKDEQVEIVGGALPPRRMEG